MCGPLEEISSRRQEMLGRVLAAHVSSYPTSLWLQLPKDEFFFYDTKVTAALLNLLIATSGDELIVWATWILLVRPSLVI
jgi:hypothetical protein